MPGVGEYVKLAKDAMIITIQTNCFYVLMFLNVFLCILRYHYQIKVHVQTSFHEIIIPIVGIFFLCMPFIISLEFFLFIASSRASLSANSWHSVDTSQFCVYNNIHQC